MLLSAAAQQSPPPLLGLLPLFRTADILPPCTALFPLLPSP